MVKTPQITIDSPYALAPIIPGDLFFSFTENLYSEKLFVGGPRGNLRIAMEYYPGITGVERLDVFGPLVTTDDIFTYGHLRVLDKPGTGYIIFATRNTSAAQTRWDLDAIGSISAFGKIVRYDGTTTSGKGVPSIVDYVALTGQTSSIGNTNLANTGLAGFFRVSVHVNASSFPTGSDTVLVTLTWRNTGGGDDTKTTSTVTLNNASQYDQMTFVVYHSGGASIRYSTTKSGAGGDGYDLHITAERLA